ADSSSEGKLLLSIGGRLVRQQTFTLTALVHRPGPGERVTLQLPDGFELVEGEAEQSVPPVPAGAARPTSPVTWRLRARNEGRFTLEVRSSTGSVRKQPITIRTQGVFD